MQSATPTHDTPVSAHTNLDNLNTIMAELLETIRQGQNQHTEGSKDMLLIRALSVISEANNIMAEQRSRIHQLEGLVISDELTKLLNRRGFQLEFARELNRTHRNASKGGVFMMIDLAGFKAVNDQYGHVAGDVYLQTVADFLRHSTRVTDILCRIGGDEFIVVLANVDSTTGQRRAEWIEKKLNEQTFVYNGAMLPMRARFGVTVYDATDHNTDAVFARADANLYTAKEQ